MGRLLIPLMSSALPGVVGRTLIQAAEGMSIPSLPSVAVRCGLGSARTGTPSSIGRGSPQMPVNLRTSGPRVPSQFTSLLSLSDLSFSRSLCNYQGSLLWLEREIGRNEPTPSCPHLMSTGQSTDILNPSLYRVCGKRSDT